MSNNILEAVVEGEVCPEFQVNNGNSQCSHTSYPTDCGAEVLSDLFILNSKDYVVLGDSYSDFIEVGELRGTTSSDITFLKKQFSRQWPAVL